MKLSREAEREILLTVRRNPDDHLRFADDAYRRPDGALPVHRDGLQEFLHRRLFRLVREEHLGRRKIIRTCELWGCVQPHHFMLVSGLVRGAKRFCVNGHEYARVGVTASGHCSVCAAQRAATRAGDGTSVAARNRAKCCCPADHEYTPENTYRQRTASGYRRKCRRCNALRASRRRTTA